MTHLSSDRARTDPTDGRDRRARDDGGFTVVEMLISLLVLAIVLPVAFGAIRNLTEQGTSSEALFTSLQQDQGAGQTLLEYLHTASAVAPSSTASSLTVQLDSGYDAASGAPGNATLTASCVTSTTSGVASLTLSYAPLGSPATLTRSYSVESEGPGNASACGLFRYGSTSSGSLIWSATASASVVAIGISATFLTGPEPPPTGEVLSTIETEVYLENVAATTTVPS